MWLNQGLLLLVCMQQQEQITATDNIIKVFQKFSNAKTSSWLNLASCLKPSKPPFPFWQSSPIRPKISSNIQTIQPKNTFRDAIVKARNALIGHFGPIVTVELVNSGSETQDI